jgi:hypothetical protein
MVFGFSAMIAPERITQIKAARICGRTNRRATKTTDHRTGAGISG